MRIFLAGTSVSSPEEEIKLQNLFKQGYKLHSYYHIPLFEEKWWKMNTKNKVRLFLDSGAFSALTQGVEINIQEYIAFIEKHIDIIDVYANLDFIGTIGKRPNKETAERTLKNQIIMESAGLNPLPVFHYGEPLSFLEYYVKNYSYVALGGTVGIPKVKQTPWFERCFSDYICDSNGYPKVKIHGFGLTSLKLMLRYPWYSVDSTSWVVTGRLGSIFVPIFKNGKWIYDENSWKISVSTQSPNLKEAGQHIDTLPPTQREIVLDYIHEKGYKLGKSEFRMELQTYKLQENEKWAQKKPKDKQEKRRVQKIIEPGISNTYQLRDEINIIYFLDVEKSMPEYPWAFQRQSRKGFF